jgi:hypothetical protein
MVIIQGDIGIVIVTIPIRLILYISYCPYHLTPQTHPQPT